MSRTFELHGVLESLLIEVEQMKESDYHDSPRARERDEKLICVIENPYWRRLWSLHQGYSMKSITSATQAVYYPPASDAHKELRANSVEWLARAEILRDLFFADVRTETGRWTDSIGVRTGWQLVLATEENPLQTLLLKLLAGPDK